MDSAGARITAREWGRVLFFALAVMALTSIPYLAGAAAQREDWRFGWFMFGVDDGNSYLAKMRQGAVGGWLFSIVYTSEPHDSAFLFTPYLAGGKIAALLASPSSPALVDAMLLVFHVGRVLFGIMLILVVYRFIAVFVEERAMRWLALVLICLGGGLGWLLILLGQGNWLGSAPLDFYVPESYTFYLLYGLPHLSLARAALLGGLLLTFGALALDNPRQWVPRSALAGACWLVMGLCVPFYIAVLYAILGVWGLAALLRERRFPVRLFLRCAVGAAVPAPFLAYNFYVFASNPVMAAWQGQNTLPSPHPLHYLAGYGLLAALALPALIRAWREHSGSTAPRLLLAAWTAAGPILVYLPIGVQRRLLEAIFVPLCILAVLGLQQWWAPFLARRFRVATRSLVALILALALPTSLLLLFSGTLATQNRDPGNRLFHTDAEIAALDWLNRNAVPGSVVLSDFTTGNYLPARASLRAFIGHGPETIGLPEKQQQATRLLAGQMPAEEQRGLFEKYSIHYVLAGPLSTLTENTVSPTLSLAYNRGGYRIFEVNLAPGP